VSLRVEASGSSPLAYQWFFNGAKLPGATNKLLTFAAAQLAHAGNYFCVASNAYGAVTSRVMSLTVFPPQVTVFLDTFDADTSAQWQINRSSADTRATFAWDYSALGIPPAPNAAGGTTRGLRLEANLAAGAPAALSLAPKGRVFTGDYRLRFDMWLNANGPFPDGGAGSTEHLTAGVGTAGNRVQWTGAGSAADGCWFAVDGEGGVSDTSSSSGDFCAYLGAALQSPASGVYLAGTESTAKGNNHPYYLTAFAARPAPPALQQTLYPQQTGALAAGAVGFAWREVLIARRGNRVDWAIDGVHLASFTNATLPGSNVFVGYWDGYASLSDNPELSFGLVDNLRVEVPADAPALTPQCTAVCLLPDGRFRLNGRGGPGLYTIEVSTNLLFWEVLASVPSADGLFEWTDARADAPQRFYRVRWSP
jgi:hypothetical protein